jgi:3-deoxy-D-manno-octulosonate 8-phosphate phosphatase (KDO 8-P phosphatase)
MKKLNKESFDDYLNIPIELLILDFDGVFTDNSVLIDENGMEYVRCTRADGIGLEKLVKTGVKVFILSTEVNNIVHARAKKLNLKAYNGIKDKGEFIRNFLHKEKINKENVMFVGNDINDIPAFKEVGVRVGVSDCSPDIEEIIHFKTKSKGGYGAVREICDILIQLKSQKYGKI